MHSRRENKSQSRKENDGYITRDIKCYDTSQILVQDKVTNRYFIKGGTNYIVAISDVFLSAGIIKTNITGINNNIVTDIEFSIGTSKLEIINTLLKAHTKDLFLLRNNTLFDII